MASILFFVEEIKFTLKQKSLYRKWILNTLLLEKKELCGINYIFCSDPYLLNINITYLNHHTLTDIITFPSHPFEKQKVSKVSTSAISGEIYISVERVKENAKLFKTDFNSELKRVLIHGVLHLCGYGDKGPLKAKKMREKEDFYISLFPSK